jgi:hypothetical protein
METQVISKTTSVTLQEMALRIKQQSDCSREYTVLLTTNKMRTCLMTMC